VKRETANVKRKSLSR